MARTATATADDNIVRDEILYLPLASIDPDPEQPRLDVDEDLAASIETHGVLQAIQVRPHPVDVDRWMIVDGERRYRGAKRAGEKTIPATITLDVEDVADRLVRQIVRNEGRPLTPWEEAQAYKRIVDERRAGGDKKYGVVQLAQELGIAKSTVSDRLALADAPAPFVPLFKKGELSAAAAPIVRKLAEVPAAILNTAIKEAREHYEWDDAVKEGHPVPLDTVRNSLIGEVLSQLRYMNADVAKRYKGPSIAFERGVYAIDVEQAQRIDAEIVAEDQKKAARKKSTAKPEDDWQARDRERRAKEAKALKKKRDEREAMFRAIAAQLPPQLEGGWLLFAIGGLLDEMQHMSRQLACKALGVEAPKSGGQYGGADYRKALAGFAQSLDDGRRVQLLLQLVLLHDTSVSQYDVGGPKRLKAAAELLGTTLDALKVDAPADNPLVEAPKTIGETFTKIVTVGMKPRELAKSLAQMSNEWVTGRIARIKEQLAKFDDEEHWPTDIPGLNTIGGREGSYLSGVDRNSVVADLAQLEAAALRRGLVDDPNAPDPDDDEQYDIADDEEQLECKYCGCTQLNACETDDGPCSWISSEPPVCSNPRCVSAFEEDEECSADVGELSVGAEDFDAVEEATL